MFATFLFELLSMAQFLQTCLLYFTLIVVWLAGCEARQINAISDQYESDK